jgi:hypothetical protein
MAEDLRERLVKAEAENARLRAVLEDIEQIGHNPADLASDLMEAHPKMEDRMWELANRLADMAHRAIMAPVEPTPTLYVTDGPQGGEWHHAVCRLRHCLRPDVNADSVLLTRAQVAALIGGIVSREASESLYFRGYAAMSASDISEYLALCGMVRELMDENDRLKAGGG